MTRFIDIEQDTGHIVVLAFNGWPENWLNDLVTQLNRADNAQARLLNEETSDNA